MLARFVVMLCAVLCLSGEYCQAQWSQLTQPELREITERLVKNKTIDVSPPWVARLWIEPNRVRLGICMGDFPRSLTDEPTFNRVLNAQLQVSVIRVYRNQPGMVSNWKSTLASVEQQITEMLVVVSSDALDEKQKDEQLTAMESHIKVLYDDFFLRWAQSEGRFDWGVYGTQIKLHKVFLNKTEPGVVRYICAGPWEIYLYAKSKGKKVPAPTWSLEVSDKVMLAGEYYFCAKFASAESAVMGPIDIVEDRSIVFEPKMSR